MDHASYHNEIDDGTDDNEVIDVQTGMTNQQKLYAIID